LTELLVRPPTLDDIDAVVELGNAFEQAFLGAESFTAGEVLDEWRQLDLEHDAWLIFVTGGRLAGYTTLEQGAQGPFQSSGYVHPELRGLGVGGKLVDLAEERARARGAISIRSPIVAHDEDAVELLERRGYRPVRHFYRMAIELGDNAPEPEWPGGLRGEPFREDDTFAFHEAIEDAWQDQWDHSPRSFEFFRERILKGSQYEPSLWTVVWAGDEIAGGTICEAEYYGMGWVRSLFVRRPWRRRGLGMALLLNAFRQFHERGERRVGLGVDAESPTGATRLYERAGMKVVDALAIYRKELA
jgi:GNAT superfamily N-acetyltransferase